VDARRRGGDVIPYLFLSVVLVLGVGAPFFVIVFTAIVVVVNHLFPFSCLSLIVAILGRLLFYNAILCCQ